MEIDLFILRPKFTESWVNGVTSSWWLKGLDNSNAFFSGTFNFVIKRTLNEDSHCSVKGDKIRVMVSKQSQWFYFVSKGVFERKHVLLSGFQELCVWVQELKEDNYLFFQYKILIGISSYNEHSKFIQDDSSNWNISLSTTRSNYWWTYSSFSTKPGSASAATSTSYNSTSTSTAPGHTKLSCTWNYSCVTGKLASFKILDTWFS